MLRAQMAGSPRSFWSAYPPDLLVTGNLLDTLITEETPKAA